MLYNTTKGLIKKGLGIDEDSEDSEINQVCFLEQSTATPQKTGTGYEKQKEASYSFHLMLVLSVEKEQNESLHHIKWV